MKRKVLLAALAALLTLVMGTAIVHADNTVKLTIRWSSIDGVDLMEPIVIDGIEPGTRISGALSARDMYFYDLFEKAGYQDMEYRTPKPITGYSDFRDASNENIPNNYILEQDTEIYCLMAKEIQNAEIELPAPLCGDSTATPEGSDPVDDPWELTGQTNPPRFTVPADAGYIPYEKANVNLMGYWIADAEFSAPYIGTFNGGEDYYAVLYLRSTFGYTFPNEPKATVNNDPALYTHRFLINYTEVYAKITAEHKWDDGAITKPASAASDGVKTYTCTVCSATKTEAIPKTGGSDGTAFGPGASAEAAEAAILAINNEKDPKGTVFGILQLKASKVTKSSIKLTWKKAAGAKKYVIYANTCGNGKKYKKLTTVTGTSTTVKKVAGAKLKKGTYYKFLMVAVDGSGKVVSTSKTVHAATAGGKVGNPTKITTKAKKNKVTVKVKKTFKLARKQAGKKIKKHRAVSYETSNVKVATVTAKGVIKGVKKGTCYVYAYAQNGLSARIKVTVK